MNKKLIAGIATAIATASMSLATITPAAAQNFNRQRSYVMQYCQSHPRDRDCYDFHRNGNHWNDSRYRGWYRSHSNGIPPAIAGIFGLAAGAIIGGAIANGNNGGHSLSSTHVARCQARFKSYDISTDSYLGYDGYRHRCTL